MSAALDTALAAVAAGRMVVIAGDRLRGGDIDLMIAARHVTPHAINFMATHGRGLICLAVTPQRAEQLGLSLVNPGTARQTGRPFARSIEAAHGVSTGISAADRAHTVQVAIAEGASSADIHSPGHVFPLIAQAGGVLARPAACEASIDLARLAGAGDAAVICSIMRDDGEMARIDDIGDLIAGHDLAVAEIGDLIARLERAEA
ncbi:3,4-dihydroxy-2-butanone-4-phosphate synthase [Porphyrobacter sp. CACIAM 03H1]|uniref:3,4-dihydroxy-2-butanone-4-phosphate synthase n=1 Tax=Porphyrobacter sp. CACIAM 03H1 TaxID=2003315 RepID=UPI000B5AB780|nr:3,4-dihydroxy-2-butanone-4-phosphate synthase [Porphyrobacter sp. CACIAM 03H1]ASJ90482.1 3,4-dihydroxy-2-butanone-4-phosphate synthase [Porphyrobacter sp. CACIAM 03H1]